MTTDPLPSLMPALICRAHGDPLGLSVGEAPTPRPKDGEVLIAVQAAGISFVDVLMVRNLHQNKHAVPFSPGMEVVGRIVECGADVGERPARLLCGGGA